MPPPSPAAEAAGRVGHTLAVAQTVHAQLVGPNRDIMQLVANTAEEAKDPARTIPLGIVLSLLACAVLYGGVVLVLASLDRGLNNLLASVGLPEPGLLFSGTLFAVVFACTVRFLTIPIQGLDAGLQNLSPNLDNAARSLGTASLPMMRIVAQSFNVCFQWFKLSDHCSLLLPVVYASVFVQNECHGLLFNLTYFPWIH